MAMGGIGAILAFLGLSGGVVNPLIGGTLLLLGAFGLRSTSVASESVMAEPAFSLESFAEQMADPEAEESALSELSWRLYSAPLDEATKAQVIDIVAAALVGPRQWQSHVTPASILVQLEGEAAGARLNSPEVLRVDNPRLAEALQVLRETQLPLDSKLQDRAIAGLLALDEVSEMQQKAIDESVTLLGRRGESARPRLDELRKNPRAQLGSLRGLVQLAGVEDPWQAVWSNETLRETHKAFMTLNSYAEVMSWGGHFAFFSSEGADAFPSAMRALENHGYKDLAAKARAAALLVDDAGWHKKQSSRVKKLEAMSEEARASLEALDDLVRERRQELEACALEVVLASPRDFGGESK